MFNKTFAYANKDNTIDTQQTGDISFIYETSISDLAEATSYYDNKTVVIEGEVIGDKVNDESNDDYCWITLTSLDMETHTVNVYVKKSDTSQIDTFGRYNSKGTTLRIKGVFHLCCNEHAGISCLHADNIEVTQLGSINKDEINLINFIPGCILIGVSIVLLVAYNKVSKKSRLML